MQGFLRSLFSPKPSPARGFLRGEEGNVAIEFALIAPVFFLLLMGVTEFSLLAYGTSALNNAVKDIAYLASEECPASKRDANLNCPAGANEAFDAAKVTSIIKSYGGGMIDPARLCIFAAPFKGGQPAGPGITTVNFGGSQDMVRINFRYRWNFFTNIVGKFFTSSNGTGILNYKSDFMVRNGAFLNATNRTLNWTNNTSACM